MTAATCESPLTPFLRGDERYVETGRKERKEVRRGKDRQGKEAAEGYEGGAQLTQRVPAADAKISQDAMDETFYLTNIAPQVGEGFNRHCGYS